jgi:hypothetical protein
VLPITLNGNQVLDARLTIPAWGVSWHDVTIAGEVTLSGAVSLAVRDLTIKGTVLSGGPAHGRSFYRLAAGAGGWGKALKKRAYSNDAGVKLVSVLSDAASEAGETLDTTTIDLKATVGVFWVRPAGPACDTLAALAPGAWYVGEDGQTRLGARAPSILPSTVTRTSQVDLARGTLTLASDSIAAILPGLSVDGLTAVDVEHTIDEQGTIRSKVWGKQGSGTSRRLAALQAIVDRLDPDRLFRGIYEYRIVSQQGERLNLQAVRVSLGLPDIQRVKVRPGLPGCKATYPATGMCVLVGFVNADQSAPVVLAFQDAESGSFLPTTLLLAGGGAAVGRVGDPVRITAAEINAAGLVANLSTGAVTATGDAVGAIDGGSSKVFSG